MEEMAIDEIGADGPVALELALHAQAEMLRMAWREIVGEEFRAGLEHVDGADRQVRVVGIDAQLLDGRSANERQNSDQCGTGEGRRIMEVERGVHRNSRDAWDRVGNDASGQ